MNFYDVISAAVRDFADNGYDSEARLEQWLERIREAAEVDLVPEAVVEQEMRAGLEAIYTRLIERGQILRQHPGVNRFGLERIKPQLHAELQRRIMASANLIKLNRAEAVESTLRQFAGWASSVPAGGTRLPVQREAGAQTRRELTKLGFQVRRVAIDQGHKFMSSLSETLAKDGGAIAAIWHQHYTRNPRHTHKQRDGRVYLVRNSWAHQEGLVKPAGHSYTDEVTQPGEEVYCRCTFEWLYGFRRLPPEMLTDKGKARLAEVRARVAA